MSDPSLVLRRSMLSLEQRNLLASRIKSGGRAPVPENQIAKRSDQGSAPLSLAQEGIWLQEQLTPGNATYNIFGALRLTGKLDIPALDQGLSEVIRRHEALRTNFRLVRGKPIQSIRVPRNIRLAPEDFTHLRGRELQRAVREWALQEGGRPFNLERDELFRVNLMKFGPEVHGILLTVHHIIADGLSFGLLFPELLSLYSGYARQRPLQLPELTHQYGDYATWQRETFSDRDAEAHLAYWRDKLSDVPLALDLPSDRARPRTRSVAGGAVSFGLSAELSEKVRLFIKQKRITLFTLMLSACGLLLHKYTGHRGILIGSPTSNRSRPELERIVGLFLNMLVFRIDFDEERSVSELIDSVRTEVLETFGYGAFPFERVVSGLRIPRESSHSPVFQVSLSCQQPRSVPPVPGLRVEHMLGSYETNRLDLSIYIAERDNGGISAKFSYAKDLFNHATIETLTDRFCRLLDGMVSRDCRLSELSLLSGEVLPEADAVRPAPSNPFELFSRRSVAQSLTTRFAEQVHRTPNAIAIVDGATVWTYAKLEHRANGFASAIIDRLGRGDGFVALLFKHEASMIAAMIGVLKAGKAYVPLDPRHPAERLRHILDDTSAGGLIAGEDCMELARSVAADDTRLIAAATIRPSADIVEVTRPPEALAYVLHTSGTTGRPKGVVQNDTNVLHFMAAYTNALHLCSADRLSLFATYGFDAAVMDIYGALLNGASLHLWDSRRSGFVGLDRWISESGITVWHSTPTVLRQAVAGFSGRASSSVRLVILGGEEALHSDRTLVGERFDPACLLVNGYGPTESTIATQYFTTTCVEPHSPRLPIGHAIEATRVLLFDRLWNNADLVGEIAVGSEHLALGYLNRPGLTAERFVPDPLGHGSRLYRTGDLGRRRLDGALEHCGRIDQQVKLRGYRIELGEIEVALREHASVRQAAVIVHGEREDARLAAYVVCKGDVDFAELRHYLRQNLPEHMMPSTLQTIDAIPITANGKLDRQRLPAPAVEAGTAKYVEPRTETEAVLAGIWMNVLGRPQVGIDDNFFDLGGHSLLVHRVHLEILELIKCQLPITALFQHPTVRSLADYLRGEIDGKEVIQSSEERGRMRKRSSPRKRGGVRSTESKESMDGQSRA